VSRSEKGDSHERSREAAPHLSPLAITTLFLGESPPHDGTFFYKQDSLLYHRMKESFGAASNFLPTFQAKGLFLDDLVLYPIKSNCGQKGTEQASTKGRAIARSTHGRL
jgi:hypothetical protein